MKKTKKYLQLLAEKASLPLSVAAGLPQTIVDGFREVSIDLQQGLESYSDTQIVVGVSLGKIVVSGTNLRIRLMKAGKIIVVGDIGRTEFLRIEK